MTARLGARRPWRRPVRRCGRRGSSARNTARSVALPSLTSWVHFFERHLDPERLVDGEGDVEEVEAVDAQIVDGVALRLDRVARDVAGLGDNVGDLIECGDIIKPLIYCGYLSDCPEWHGGGHRAPDDALNPPLAGSKARISSEALKPNGAGRAATGLGMLRWCPHPPGPAAAA